MDKLFGGIAEQGGVPKMSVLVINAEKDNGALFKKKLEDSDFKDIRSVEYKDGSKDKLKKKVHAIVAMIAEERQLETYQAVLDSYKNYAIRILVLSNEELKQQPVP